MSYRKGLFGRFSGLFGAQDNDGDDDEQDDEKRVNSIDDSKALAEEKINKKWNWMNIIDRLAEGNILNYEKVVKLSAIMCLTYLSFKNETNK